MARSRQAASILYFAVLLIAGGYAMKKISGNNSFDRSVAEPVIETRPKASRLPEDKSRQPAHRSIGAWTGILGGAFLVVVGIGLLLYPWLSDLRYARYQNDLKARAVSKAPVVGKKTERTHKATPKSPPKPQVSWSLPDGVVAHLIIPKIGLDTFVVEGTDAEALNKGPGHYEETPLPGRGGNTAFAGHRTMYGHPFRNLDQLVDGDAITVYTKEKKVTYRVIKVQLVFPKNVSVVAPTADNRLTLTTCAPVGSARQRLVVTAREVNG